MISARFIRTFIIALPILALTVSVTGCGRSGPAISDVDAATQLLRTSFESWKSGSTVASLREATPPVYVAEEMWDAGFALSDFTVDGDGEVYGTNVRFLVTLNGKDKNGSTVSRQMKYLVTTTPALTIARADR